MHGKTEETKISLIKENKHGTQPVTIPESVRWAIQHPYQGGGVSPK